MSAQAVDFYIGKGRIRISISKKQTFFILNWCCLNKTWIWNFGVHLFWDIHKLEASISTLQFRHFSFASAASLSCNLRRQSRQIILRKMRSDAVVAIINDEPLLSLAEMAQHAPLHVKKFVNDVRKLNFIYCTLNIESQLAVQVVVGSIV